MLVWTSDAANGGNGPLSLTFGTHVAGVGALLQADGPGKFVATIQVFNNVTSLGTFSVSSDTAGDPVYIGVLDQSGANITSAVFSITTCTGNCSDFAIDTIFLAVPGVSNVNTAPATAITASSATLNGTVNPQGSNGLAYFEWGTSSTLSSFNGTCFQASACSVINNFTTQSFSYTLNGLLSNTHYYFRMVFFNSENGTYRRGTIAGFLTKNPAATSAPATAITASSATLNGTVNPQGSNGLAYFEWGTSSTLSSFNGTCFQASACSVINNFTTQSFSYTLNGLLSNTHYYFRMVFFNSENGTYRRGTIAGFLTL